MGARSRATKSYETKAFVLRRTPYREADLVVTLFTAELGQVSAVARAARKSQRRFGGSLEPFHTLEVELDEPSGAALMTLRGARIVTPRPGLYERLDAMEAAGQLLTWIRHCTPAHTPEPRVWVLVCDGLDALDTAARPAPAGAAEPPGASPRRVLASLGLQLLAACGWRLELERCVQSGARCPDGKAAMIDPERGGLVSRAEGGAPFRVSGPTRQRLIRAQEGERDALAEQDANLGLELVERCLRAHAGLAS